jgi:hypothetical protein
MRNMSVLLQFLSWESRVNGYDSLLLNRVYGANGPKTMTTKQKLKSSLILKGKIFAKLRNAVSLTKNLRQSSTTSKEPATSSA